MHNSVIGWRVVRVVDGGGGGDDGWQHGTHIRTIHNSIINFN